MIGIVMGIILEAMQPITYEEWNNITPGISIEKLETEIGKPKDILTETQEMLDAVNADTASMSDIVKDIPYLADTWSELFEEESEVLDLLYESISMNQDIKVYEYTVGTFKDNGSKFAYFYKGSLFHRTGFLVSGE